MVVPLSYFSLTLSNPFPLKNLKVIVVLILNGYLQNIKAHIFVLELM